MFHSLRYAAAFGLLVLVPSAPAQVLVGSPVVNRALNDGSAGVVYLYLGGTQPAVAPGQIVEWAFFDDDAGTLNHKVTPLFFERTAANSWTVIAIGTSRSSTAAGVQRHPFASLGGNTALEQGKQYTVGFVHREFSLSGSTIVSGPNSGGVVDFDGYNNFTDRWAYALGLVALGTVLGDGGLPLDNLGAGGRICSAQFTVSRIVSVPGCNANPAQLASTVSVLSLGSSFQLNLGSPSIQSGAWQVYLGFSFVTRPSACGIPLQGIGEFMILPGSQLLLGGGALSSGAGHLPLLVPNQTALVGGSVMFQGLVAGLSMPGVPLQLTNGLWAMIAL